MTRSPFPPLPSLRPAKVTSALFAVLVASTLALQADEKDRDKKPERQPRSSSPAPHQAPEAKRETHEARRELKVEARQETAPEPRREPRPESRREQPPPSRHEPSPKRWPTSAPDASREGFPTPRPAPIQDPSRTPSQTLRPNSSPDREERGREDLRPNQGRQGARPPQGGEIHRAPAGGIWEVHTPGGAVIRHSPSGTRQVEVAKPGGRVIVASASGRSGYVQRPLALRDHAYLQRTYILQGVPQARIYRPWTRGGTTLHLYTPTYYYRPAFYAWGHRAWERPVHYRWGWETRPWYGYYGGYFTPYVTYSSPVFWLADFFLATTLEAAYLSQTPSSGEPPRAYAPATGLSPEVKEAIAEEVRRQLDQEQAEEVRYRSSGQANGLPALFSDQGPRTFVVANTIFAYAGDRECPLVEGDVLQLLATPHQDDETADLRVLSSRGGGCGQGSLVSVRLTDLQEMHNHLRATLHQGLSALQANAGKQGLPALSAEVRGVMDTTLAREIRPDPTAVEDVNQAAREANRAEQELIRRGGLDGGSAVGMASIKLGMTLPEVEKALGKPKGTVDLGKKQIYLYPELKITFLNGRVSDVQ